MRGEGLKMKTHLGRENFYIFLGFWLGRGRGDDAEVRTGGG
jgi:hypothetical protein